MSWRHRQSLLLSCETRYCFTLDNIKNSNQPKTKQMTGMVYINKNNILYTVKKRLCDWIKMAFDHNKGRDHVRWIRSVPLPSTVRDRAFVRNVLLFIWLLPFFFPFTSSDIWTQHNMAQRRLGAFVLRFSHLMTVVFGVCGERLKGWGTRRAQRKQFWLNIGSAPGAKKRISARRLRGTKLLWLNRTAYKQHLREERGPRSMVSVCTKPGLRIISSSQWKVLETKDETRPWPLGNLDVRWGTTANCLDLYGCCGSKCRS